VNPRPFNFQWFVPCDRQHVAILTDDGALYVGPEGKSPPKGERFAFLSGGPGGHGSTGRMFHIAGNDVIEESPIIAPGAPGANGTIPFRERRP